MLTWKYANNYTYFRTPSKDTQDNNKAGVNLFSNDGSFLDQFKQMKDKKSESKFKAFNKFKDREREREKEKEVGKDKRCATVIEVVFLALIYFF